MATPHYKQDLPPEGGYSPFNFKRIPAKVLLSGYRLFGLFAVFTGFSWYMLKNQYVRKKLIEIEAADGHNALQPLLLAERDRMFLKQLKKNRDEERELMKNVPGWVVGTYFGEPIYKTISPDTHIDPVADEFFAHADPKVSYDIWHYWDTNY
ncbi:NADH dehydrogenase (ubiquinone) B16.6 subunit [Dermacentor variabilis]|uniref:NADH dehydrogenase (ubiquinone) B16.6 subunit n=1 Tax=Dermacentor variabilis TaxID=34621 RepID=UPI003F5B6016